jgi:hypothetical protein
MGEKLSYNVAKAAAAIDVGQTHIREAIKIKNRLG